MRLFGGRLIERYIIQAILPYVGLSLFLLTFVLVTQQAGKFVEILGSTNATLRIVADIALGLMPNIVIFTLPMSVLIGTAIGLSRLGGDSELTALRAAGVGIWRFLSPVLLLGIFFSFLTLYVAFEIAPAATTLMREAAFRVALAKIESPIEPNSFNTQLPGKVVYVGRGDREHGQWNQVFIHWQEEGQDLRLITAATGRLDNTGEQTELVLNDAIVTTLPTQQKKHSALRTTISETSAQFRIRLNTRQNTLRQKFNERQGENDELHWRQIVDKIRATKGVERRNLQIMLHKKLALCFAPLAFAVLGAGLGGRPRKRVSRGQALFLSLCSMLIYYLLLLGGEQLSRTGRVPPELGGWLATGLTLIAGACAFFVNGNKIALWQPAWTHFFHRSTPTQKRDKRSTRSFMLFGRLDRSLFRAVSFNFTLVYLILLGIFLIFTLFELLRFINSTEWAMVLLYLLYLVPLASMTLAPISLLVAVLITYALLARRREIVVWWASGQSLYRLAVPALVFALFLSLGLWVLQEKILPQANRTQESYRAQIRGGPNRAAVTPSGFQWLSIPSGNRIYSYKFDGQREHLLQPVVYEFDSRGIHLTRLIVGERAGWDDSGKMKLEGAEITNLQVERAGNNGSARFEQLIWPEETRIESFKPMLNKPSELSSRVLSEYIRTLKSVKPEEAANLSMTLYRRSADIVTPIILTIIGVPCGVIFGRRSAFWVLGAAISFGLLLWACASGFQQLGNYKILPVALAAWATPLIFTTFALALFSRART